MPTLLIAQSYRHDVPRDLIPQQPLVLSVETIEKGDYTIKCFYKFNRADEYSTQELMTIGPRQHQLSIDIPEQIQSIEYFFWVYKDNVFVETFPEKNVLELPFMIINTSQSVDYFTLLTPQSDQKIPYKKDMLFVVKNNFPKIVTYKSATLNDDESLKKVSESAFMLTLKNTFPIRRDVNKLTLKGQLKDGTEVSKTVTITTQKERLKEKFKTKGKTQLSHLLYSSNKESTEAHKDFEMAYSGTVHASSTKYKSTLYGLYDNRESKYTQPYSRFSGDIGSKKGAWKVKIGDHHNSFSSLTVNGARVRGVSAKVDFFKFFNTLSSLTLTTVSGGTNRAISVSSGNITVGTFKQKLTGYQLKYSSMKTKVGVQYFHIKDEENSLTSENAGTTDPIENHLLSALIQMRPTPLSHFKTEIAGAAYYSDTRAPTINIDELDLKENIKKFIEKRLPIKSSLTAGFASRTAIQLPLYSKHRVLKVGFDYIQPSYTNVLNSSLETDKKETSIGITQKLFNRKWILSGQVKAKQDNVMQSASETSFSNSYRLNSMLQTKSLGAFNVSSFITRRTEDVTTGNADVNTQLNYYLVSLSGIPLKTSVGKMSLNLNYSISEYLDYETSDNNTYTNAWAGSLRSKYKHLRISTGLNHSTSRSGLSGKTSYFTVFAKANRYYKKRTLKLASKIKMTTGKNSSSNSSYQLNSTKMIYGVTLTIKRPKSTYFKQSRFVLGVDYITMTDSADKDDKNANFSEIYTSIKMTNKF